MLLAHCMVHQCGLFRIDEICGVIRFVSQEMYGYVKVVSNWFGGKITLIDFYHVFYHVCATTCALPDLS